MSGTSGNVKLGAGQVNVAPIGTTMPTTRAAALDAAFRDVGYTDGGVTITYALRSAAIDVDQQLDPVANKTTGRSASITFPMAEATVTNLGLALNAGAAVANAAFEPPDLGTEVPVIIVFDAESGARWLLRQCSNASEVSIPNAKAPAKRLIAVTFRLEKPTGARPFKVFPATDGTL